MRPRPYLYHPFPSVAHSLQPATLGRLLSALDGSKLNLAAVPALGCTSGHNVFNSAVLVFRPSLKGLEALLRRERSYANVGQACEVCALHQAVAPTSPELHQDVTPPPSGAHQPLPWQYSFTDQSILNAEHRGGCQRYDTRRVCHDVIWKRLPLSYNVNVQLFSSFSPTYWSLAEVAVVHYKGPYAKPWVQIPVDPQKQTKEQRKTHERMTRLMTMWRETCAPSWVDDDLVAPTSRSMPWWSTAAGLFLRKDIRPPAMAPPFCGDSARFPNCTSPAQRRPRQATAGHGKPRQAAAGHGKPRQAMTGLGRPRPWQAMATASLGKPASPRAPPADEWRLLPNVGSGKNCSSGGSFISIVKTDQYVPAALCLQNQLRHLGSVCPLTLVYDESTVSEEPLARLRRAFGSRRLIALSDLVARAEPAVRHAQGGGRARGKRLRRRAGHLTTGNRSTRAGPALAWELRTLQKLWLWSLPKRRYPVVAFIDLDMLVLANLDP